jgi:hypothetical protein
MWAAGSATERKWGGKTSLKNRGVRVGAMPLPRRLLAQAEEHERLGPAQATALVHRDDPQRLLWREPIEYHVATLIDRPGNDPALD